MPNELTAQAAKAGALNTDLIGNLLMSVISFINTFLVPLVFALAFIVFLWGVFNYFIRGAADEEARGKGKQLVFWGMVGFFVMISIWGMVNLVVHTLPFGQQNNLRAPIFDPYGTHASGSTFPTTNGSGGCLPGTHDNGSGICVSN
jgi:hypothetical protein